LTPPPVDPRGPGPAALPIEARLSELVARVLAPNPSHMTLDGTNTYVLAQPGSGSAFVVDPGPSDPEHLERVRKTLAGIDAECAGILVTHHHLDHSEAAVAWGAGLSATVWAPTPEVAGPGGRVLHPGRGPAAGGLTVEVVPTPGHTADHVCFRLPDGTILSGDHILGRGTSVVAWPEGDLAAYLESLRRVLDLGPAALFPGHGPQMTADPASVIDYYLAHRSWREEQVVAALDHQPDLAADPRRLVELVYSSVDPRLWPAAELSTRACLEKLRTEGRTPV
jgi:glyoxylase-like metal-dependent hydrolase (beta-lactamase superfamily II)